MFRGRFGTGIWYTRVVQAGHTRQREAFKRCAYMQMLAG